MPQRIPWSRSIGTRLSGLVLLLFLVALAMTAINTYLMGQIRGSVAWTSLVSEGGRLRSQLLNLLEDQFEQAPERRSVTRQAIDGIITSIEQRFVELQEGPEGGGPALRDQQLENAVAERRAVWDTQVLPLVRRIAGAPSREAVSAELAQLRELTSIYVDYVSKATRRAGELAEAEIARIQTLQIAFAVTSLLVFVLVLAVTRGVTRRVTRVSQAADLVAQGDLSASAGVTGQDEVAALGRSFDEMTRRLREGRDLERSMRERLEHLIAEVREGATRLATSTNQIVASTNQQASSAQEQAGAISETVAVVEELAAMSDEAARSARQAAETARQSDDVGRRGRAAVEEAVRIMGQAKEQSDSVAESIVRLAEQTQAVTEIIALVDDISDQTNMLALNAAIEASRAGEHGRGFSVVATEVRSLAERAKAATVEIRRNLGDIQSMASSSVLSMEQYARAMKDATRSAEESGATILRLAQSIGEMAEVSSTISGSTSQQAEGLAQISGAMKDVKTGTDQTVKAVWQSEQALKDLNGLAIRLTELLDARS